MTPCPLVTIAIPTFNRAKAFLPQALQSAVNQTYGNIEILVSDNCSDDDTESVVSSFCDHRIQYFKQKENIGFLNNVNFCIQKAKGEYLLLLFDDDLIDKDFVECCLNAVKGHSNVGLILTGTRLVDEEGVVKSETNNQGSGRSVEEFCLGWFENKFPLYLCSTLFLTRGLRDIGGIRSQAYSYCDVAAEVQIAAQFNTVDVFDVKASFRKHANNMGATVMKVQDWYEDSYVLLKLMCALSIQRKVEVQAVGMKYFCERNYHRAAKVSSLLQRFSMYVKISQKFHHAYSLPFFFYRQGKNYAARLVRKFFS